MRLTKEVTLVAKNIIHRSKDRKEAEKDIKDFLRLHNADDMREIDEMISLKHGNGTDAVGNAIDSLIQDNNSRLDMFEKEMVDIEDENPQM